MPYQRGDIVEVPFLMPHNNTTANHPVVIVSNEEVYDNDGCYIGVMLTTSTYKDMFTFEIADSMLSRPNNQTYAQARCHLISYFLQSHIVPNSNRNRMRENVVDKLVAYVSTCALEKLP